MFDIEASDLRGNKGVIICSDVKLIGGGHITRVNQNLGKDGLNDKDLCIQIKKDLEDCWLIIGFYTLNYDMKFLNTRLLYWGQSPVRKTLHIDLYRLVRRHFSATRRNLATVGEILGIKQKKTYFEIQIWLEAAINGNREAIKKIVEHNKIDTELTEKVFMKLKELVTSISIA